MRAFYRHYSLFRCKGIIGGEGWYGEEVMLTLEEAEREFESEFYEQTGNQWADRHNFQKKYGKKAMVDVSYERVRKS